MYVCICNAIREREIETLIAPSVRDVEDVYRGLGVEPECCSCRDHIRSMVETPGVSDAA